MAIEPVEEDAVICIQPASYFVGPNDQNRLPVLFHFLQCAGSNQVVNLAYVVAIHLDLDRLAIFTFDRSKRRVGDNSILLLQCAKAFCCVILRG